MGIIENPIGSGGQSDRIADIKSNFASGAITQEEYDSLLRDEAVTSNYVGLKRASLAAFLLMVGALFVWSSF